MCELDPFPWDFGPLAFDFDPFTWDGWPELASWAGFSEGDHPESAGQESKDTPCVI